MWSKKFKGQKVHIGQIKTYEGKIKIVAFLAALKVKHGYNNKQSSTSTRIENLSIKSDKMKLHVLIITQIPRPRS